MCIVGLKYKAFSVNFLSGGNQRELARAKNLKKQQEQAKKKGGESGLKGNDQSSQICLQSQKKLPYCKTVGNIYRVNRLSVQGETTSYSGRNDSQSG